MFPKLPLLATALLATLAVAAPGGSPPPPPPAPPGTQNVCCTTVGTNKNPVISAVAALLGLDISDVLGDIGIGCTLLSVLGNTCSNTAVNCDATQLGGLINIGCVPITL
ncbi:fungal hydrophobin [Mycena pura]|uniref:Hydrophobin n=1 Tax=Mycena pura TaxID=153505 RepID=A0AAD6UVL4_9AGAR|nr:fungal hydrophobin [Mycena pura]